MKGIFSTIRCAICVSMCLSALPVSAAPVCDVSSVSRSATLFSSSDIFATLPLLSTADDVSCVSVSVTEHAVSDLLPSFGYRPESARVAGFSLQDTADGWFWRMQGSRLVDPVDDSTDKARLDGSYLGYRFDTWQVLAGWPERWWGPSWQGSLFAGTNSRPPPGVTFETHEPIAFEHWSLAWMGDVQVSFFANQLESDRFVPRAKQFGFRWTMRPTENLELAFSRTAMFGGEGRPETLRSLLYMIAGHDNSNVNRLNAPLDPDDEPGNQLGGFDARWTHKLNNGHAMALYGQVAGEDRSGILPSKMMALGGVEFRGGDAAYRWLWYLEGAVTSADALRLNEDIFNVAYNHGLYRDGYRYRGRALGHPADSDSIQVAAGGMLQLTERHALSWQLRRSRLNRDGAGMNTVSMAAADVRDARVEYEYRWKTVTFSVSAAWQEWREETGRTTEKGVGVGVRFASE